MYLESAPIGIAGTGRLAQALGRILREQGEPVVSIAGRDAGRTRAAAEFIGGVEPASFGSLPRHAGRFLIAVSDRALEEVARALAAGCPAGGMALHTCGAAGEEALECLRERGVACGTLHPLQTVAAPETGAAALEGAAFAISGDPAAAAWAERIAGSLGGTVLRVPASARPLYHAAAAMASNYVTALMDAAVALMAAATGADCETSRRALAPLARAAMENVIEKGAEAALTGPIERGDAGTVARHLEALAAAPVTVRELYRAAGLHTLDLARRKGLDAGAAQHIDEMLRRGIDK